MIINALFLTLILACVALGVANVFVVHECSAMGGIPVTDIAVTRCVRLTPPSSP
jgi:hypothetical protein